jgi:hypothetical protein
MMTDDERRFERDFYDRDDDRPEPEFGPDEIANRVLRGLTTRQTTLMPGFASLPSWAETLHQGTEWAWSERAVRDADLDAEQRAAERDALDRLEASVAEQLAARRATLLRLEVEATFAGRLIGCAA